MHVQLFISSSVMMRRQIVRSSGNKTPSKIGKMLMKQLRLKCVCALLASEKPRCNTAHSLRSGRYRRQAPKASQIEV